MEMEPLVFEIANLLNSTLSPDNLVLDSATRSLLTLSLQQPAAPLALLSITTGRSPPNFHSSSFLLPLPLLLLLLSLFFLFLFLISIDDESMMRVVCFLFP